MPKYCSSALKGLIANWPLGVRSGECGFVLQLSVSVSREEHLQLAVSTIYLLVESVCRCPLERSEVLWRDNGMPKGWLCDWGGMATTGKQTQRRVWQKASFLVCLCVLAISNRCIKDSSCAHKGLVTNCPHHSTPIQQISKSHSEVASSQ
jgi:hypothetical protein